MNIKNAFELIYYIFQFQHIFLTISYVTFMEHIDIEFTPNQFPNHVSPKNNISTTNVEIEESVVLNFNDISRAALDT